MRQRASVAIIGAGLAGITLARALGRCAHVRIFDKSHGVGGRMATRRRDDVAFDHGAQYFTVRDAGFRALLSQLEATADGVSSPVKPWQGEIVTLAADGSTKADGRSGVRYVGVPAMNALPKALAEGLDIVLNAKVTAIHGSPGHWTVLTEHGTEGPFDWVVTTAPAPQSAAVLPGIFQHHAALAEVRMNACFTLMMTPQAALSLPFVAARPDDAVLDWIARNETKPDRAAGPCLTVNATAAWSDANIETPAEEVRLAMLDALRAYLPLTPDDIAGATVHRWRYANVARAAGQPFLLDTSAQLAACGDWCIAGRVEAAFLSGTALADTLHSLLKGATA